MRTFEFEEQKSKANLRKHGINFIEAQELWEDPDLVEIPAKVGDEPRFLIIGLTKGKHWSAVVTPRDEYIRIISVRRSRVEDVAAYES